jgi:hypothetical protein
MARKASPLFRALLFGRVWDSSNPEPSHSATSEARPRHGRFHDVMLFWAIRGLEDLWILRQPSRCTQFAGWRPLYFSIVRFFYCNVIRL